RTDIYTLSLHDALPILELHELVAPTKSRKAEIDQVDIELCSQYDARLVAAQYHTIPGKCLRPIRPQLADMHRAAFSQHHSAFPTEGNPAFGALEDFRRWRQATEITAPRSSPTPGSGCAQDIRADGR